MSKTPTTINPQPGKLNFWQQAGGALKGTGLIGSLIGGGLSLLGNHINQKRARKQAKQERQWNIEDWNRVNEYNTPQAQMQRFKDANLNPNLMYGQGTPGLAGDIGQSEAHQAPFQMDNPLNAYYNHERHTAGMDLIQKQTQGIDQDNQRKAEENKYLFLKWIEEAKYIPKNEKLKYQKLLLSKSLESLILGQASGAAQYWAGKQPSDINSQGIMSGYNKAYYERQGTELMQALQAAQAGTEKQKLASFKEIEKVLKAMPEGALKSLLKLAAYSKLNN